MAIIAPIIRPPAEADSFLLQVTCGCSDNHCTFCGAYLNKPFRMKPVDEIYSDIAQHARIYPDTRRVFLIDGDALIIKNKQLIPILKKLGKTFPKLVRVSSYANGYNLTNKSDSDFKELYEHKLRLVYIGLESGSQEILDYCNKRSSVAEMVEGVNRLSNQAIKSSVILLLGLGQKKYSKIHVDQSIKALNKMQPRYLSFLSLMLIPTTKMDEQRKAGEFEELSPIELLQESRDIISGLEMEKTIFRSNHASNHLALEARLPRDKDRLLTELTAAINGESALRPDFLRGL
ncbi:MAG: radical SAM protein [Candidatus Omnitrophica bacterium]|nr:radical SAM protein [Candidatus Omnitrophota bacterium]